MRYSRSILVLLVLALIALTACSSSTQNGLNSPFIGGSKALDFSFIPGAPPTQIFDNKQGSFQITLQLNNVGESDINTNDGYVQIEGISPAEFGVSSAEFKQQLPAIKGAKKTSSGTVVPGNEQLVTFGPLTYQQSVTGNIASNKIIATACYNYMTSATSQLCVKESGIDDPSKTNDVCKISDPKTVANSAGPIQVTTVNQIPLGAGKVQVQFEVGKTSTDATELFFKKDTDCDDSQTNFNKYVVYVNVLPIDNSLISADCTGWQNGNGGSSGYITLFDGAPRQLQCTFNVGSTTTDYQTPVNVQLEYRYMQQVSTSILIKDVSISNGN